MLDQKLFVTFGSGSSPKIEGVTNEFLDQFEIEIETQKLSKIQNLIAKSDVGFGQTITRGQQVVWNFQMTQDGLRTRRFTKFAPMVFRDKQNDRALYNYQNEGIQWLRNNPKCILADDMGLGKTLQVIKACEIEIFENKIEHIFIFCPNALVSNWLRELRKWFSLTTAEMFTAGQLSRLTNSVNFVVVSYPQMQNFLSEYDNLLISKDNIAVFDEAHKLRNNGAQISRLSKYFNTSFKWLLTGTPLERDEKDIATILNVLDPGLYVSKLKNDKFLMKSRFQNLTLRRTKDSALKDLPPVSKHIHYVKMNKTQKSEYESILSEYKYRPKTEKIGVLTKLMITASDQATGVSQKLSEAIDTLNEKIEKKEKSIIFSRFNNILEKLSSVLNTKSIDHVIVHGKFNKEERELSIKRFQSDEGCHALLINLSIGSEGLTLTEANNVIFLNEAWNPSMNRQAEDRVNRIGQHRNVDIHIFRTKNSIDMHLEQILLKKCKLENEYIELLIAEVFP